VPILLQKVVDGPEETVIPSLFMRFAVEASDDGAAQSRPRATALFVSFDEAVPHDHPVRKIAAVLDLSWVHSDLAPFYPKMGRPSIDPELMIRMLIIGYGIRNSLGASYTPGCTGELALPLVLWALDRGQDPKITRRFHVPVMSASATAIMFRRVFERVVEALYCGWIGSAGKVLQWMPV